jgi:bifunctional DNA-binding transcriptional regulator/antitoxin component of YhaV-PrlF toxin-antitoxin module
MTVAFKNDNKTPLVVPRAVRRRAGFKSGQELEIKASGGVITILPKLPTADDEYTPRQRRIIDARLAKGLADIKAGRTRGPFNSADEMIADMKGRLAKRASAKRAKRSR